MSDFKIQKNSNWFSQNKNVIISVGVIILFVVGLILIVNKTSLNKPQANNQVSSSLLISGQTLFDFGSISMAAGKVSHNFKIRNNSDKEIIISKIYTSCMCTSASLIKDDKKFGPYGMPGHSGFIPRINESIQPGEEASVEVVFDPAAHGPAGVGNIERVVYLETSDGIQKLNIKAIVTP